MTGNNLEIISQIVLWYENSFHIDCTIWPYSINDKLAKVHDRGSAQGDYMCTSHFCDRHTLFIFTIISKTTTKMDIF